MYIMELPWYNDINDLPKWNATFARKIPHLVFPPVDERQIGGGKWPNRETWICQKMAENSQNLPSASAVVVPFSRNSVAVLFGTPALVSA